MADSAHILERLRGLHPQLIDLSLGRIAELLAAMGNPHERLPAVLHVAGTNGKGSTCAFLKAILEAAGRRVCVFTSPHLVRFHERIELPGPDGRARPIEEARLVELLERTERLNAGRPMTFFEITTAAAFLAFSETRADAIVLEVGLGGRFDATNVVRHPAMTLITPISIDHVAFLGDTLAKIAFEKAGILKKGVPCVTARQADEAMAVIEARAREVRAPLFAMGEHFEAHEQNGRLVVQEDDALYDLPLPGLVGRHQLANAGLAVAALHRLRDRLGIDEAAMARGVVGVRWPARMQRIASGPLASRLQAGSELWLDGGHNPGGARVIASVLADLEERASKPVVLIVGMLKTKDAAGFLETFRGLVRAVLAVPIPSDPNALDTASLAGMATACGLPARGYDSLAEALDGVGAHVDGPARVLMCGSLHFAGHVLALEQGHAPDPN